MKREIARPAVVLVGLAAGVLLLTTPPDMVEAGGCWGMTGTTTTGHSCGWTPSSTFIQCNDAGGAHNHHHHHNKDLPRAKNRCDRTRDPTAPPVTIPGPSVGLSQTERIAWREVILKVTGTTMGNPNTTSTTAAPTTATSTTTTNGSGSGGGSSGGSGSGSGSGP